MVAFSMVPFLGTVRSTPSLTSLAPYKRQISIRISPVSFPRNGFFPFRRFLQACLQSSSATMDTREKLPAEHSEIIFIGTGTSEGIPRVSCLTDPVKKCLVCSKAAEPGNINRRRNTSLLIRYGRPSGRCNILIDAGKFFYHSALQWFPEFGS